LKVSKLCRNVFPSIATAGMDASSWPTPQVVPGKAAFSSGDENVK
jgi:hypothetical protein